MIKECIYYTDNMLDPKIERVCRDTLRSNFHGDIISVSLKPIDFGMNCVVYGLRGYKTMIKQILVGLTQSMGDYVFFTEHDVLYSKSHFDFKPPRDDVFYYNSNVYRWMYGSDTAIMHDRMLPLSSLCVNREFAREHYSRRMAYIHEHPEEFESREPAMARKWGYEPGTKKTRRGGFSDDDFETWSSELPIVDIRHGGTFSPPKIKLSSFKHKPQNWREIPADDVPGWNLKELFK